MIYPLISVDLMEWMAHSFDWIFHQRPFCHSRLRLKHDFSRSHRFLIIRLELGWIRFFSSLVGSSAAMSRHLSSFAVLPIDQRTTIIMQAHQNFRRIHLGDKTEQITGLFTPSVWVSHGSFDAFRSILARFQRYQSACSTFLYSSSLSVRSSIHSFIQSQYNSRDIYANCASALKLFAWMWRNIFHPKCIICYVPMCVMYLRTVLYSLPTWHTARSNLHSIDIPRCYLNAFLYFDYFFLLYFSEFLFFAFAISCR